MNLYIVRHGEAGHGQHDAARLLTDRGRVEVEQVAAAVGQRGAKIFQIRHSGMARTRQTAEIFARILDPPAGVIAATGIQPDDLVDSFAHSLYRERESLMLVGHLPFVAVLVGLLIHADVDRYPVSFSTATVACLQGEADHWELAWTEHAT